MSVIWRGEISVTLKVKVGGTDKLIENFENGFWRFVQAAKSEYFIGMLRGMWRVVLAVSWPTNWFNGDSLEGLDFSY